MLLDKMHVVIWCHQIVPQCHCVWIDVGLTRSQVWQSSVGELPLFRIQETD